MNLKAVYEEVRRIMPTGNFCLKLEIWDFDGEGPEIKTTIYDGHEHLSGSDWGVALTLFRDKHRLQLVAEERLSVVADVQLPDVNSGLA